MTAWALWDRLVPVLAVIASGAVGVRFGRALERAEWLSGRRTGPGHRRG